MDKNKKKLLLMIVAILGLIVITIGVTYAFFSYTKEGTKDNTITTGTITFLYTEVSGVGKGISLTDAFPITDTQGKKLTGEGNVFDFKVTSTTPNKTAIPYEVTARKSSDSNLVEEAVRIYLTKVSGTSEEEVLLDNYNKLPQTTKVQESKYTEKTIYTGKVPADSPNYEQNFRLRMWVDEDTNFSPDKDGNYPYNDKKFTITVNVYANAKVVTEEDIADAATAEISKISVGDTELTKVEDETLGYNYETTLPEGTTSTTLDIETQGEYATVTVERVDSLAYTSNIKRLSTKKTVELNPGDNYFKITVTSENKDKKKEYILNIYVGTVCEYNEGYTWNFANSGQELFSVPCDGNYKIELWGASGGGSQNIKNYAGYGAYTAGNIYFKKTTDLYVYVGGEGKTDISYGSYSGTYAGGYNGGGTGSSNVYVSAGSGGGATDIRIVNGEWNNFDSLKSRIMVAAGGGASTYWNNTNIQAGSGGGLTGYDGIQLNASSTAISGNSTGGTQISGGFNSKKVISGGFGTGGNITYGGAAGGGSGYFGGAAGIDQTACTAGGGGGSSFISGHNGSIAITKDSTSDNVIQRLDSSNNTCVSGTTDVTCSYHYSGYKFTNTKMIDGNGYNWTTVKGSYTGQTQPNGTTSKGHQGNGYARITYLGNN